MFDTHQCSYACGLGSTTKWAKDIDMEKERQLRVRIAARSPQSKYSWSAGKKASKNAWTQVEPRSTNDARQPDLNHGVVYVRETDTERGLGVFAGRNLPKGYEIIRERPIFSCYHWAIGRRTAVAEWSGLSHRHRDEMRVWFRKLRKVPHGGNDAFSRRGKERLETFITDYAFLDPQRDRAHVYKLSCYINHACRSCANAEFWVDSEFPNVMSVKLVREVKHDDEIFICYHKPNLFYGCALCRHGQTLRGRLWAFVKGLGTHKRKADDSDDEPPSDDAETAAATPDSSASDDTPSVRTKVDSRSSQTPRWPTLSCSWFGLYNV